MQSDRPTRRDVLQRLGAAGLVLGGAAALGRWRWDHGGIDAHRAEGARQVRDFRLKQAAGLELPELVVARHTFVGIAKAGAGNPNDGKSAEPAEAVDPGALARRAVDALGGMKRFISRGDVVVVKPNIGWDRLPIHAANTNPFVVAEVVKMAFEAGAKQVVVTDASCNDPNRCFQRSGIWRAAYKLGANVIVPAEHRFRTMRLNGDVLDEWPVYTPLVEADKLINVPVAKHHNLAKYTGAMKNWYGSLGGRRNRLHQSIDVSVADLATFMRPTLVVVDATRVLVRNGPQGGNVDDTREMNTVIATTDQVAADAFGATLIGQKRDNIPYLKMGHERGLGTMFWENLRLKEV